MPDHPMWMPIAKIEGGPEKLKAETSSTDSIKTRIISTSWESCIWERNNRSGELR